MRAKIYITIEDDVSEEQMTAAGVSRAGIRDIYMAAFGNMLRNAQTPDSRTDLRVEVDDNTKETKR